MNAEYFIEIRSSSFGIFSEAEEKLMNERLDKSLGLYDIPWNSKREQSLSHYDENRIGRAIRIYETEKVEKR